MENHSENLNALFYELVREAVGSADGLSHKPSYNEWEALYDMVVKQGLVGVCFAALQRLGADADEGFAQIGISEVLYFTWMGMAVKIQQRNETVDEHCAALQKRLYVDGFRSCLLKGQGVARLYGEQLRPLRQSGDIDVWVDASRDKVIDYGMQIKPTKEFDEKHMHYQCFDDTDVEAHWLPVNSDNPLWNRSLGKYFESERERQFTNVVDGLCMPTDDFQLVHQLLHVYGHFVYEGVGMRQMMDLYFAQKACTDGVDKVTALFKELNLVRFVAATQWVLKEVFLMPSEQLLCEPDSREGQKLLDEILLGGNFGKHDAQNHKKGETFIQRFFRRWGRKFRMIRFDILGAVFMPFMRMKLEFWMRKVRNKYGV